MGSNSTRVVHQGFVFQEAAGVRFALSGASYFLPHTADVGTTLAKAVVDAYPWSPDGTDVHAPLAGPAVVPFVAAEPWADGVAVAKFEYVVGARTASFTELFVTGDIRGALLVGKKAITLRKSQLPYVFSEDAVAKGWMPAVGDSALPASLETDIPPDLRYWNAADAETAQAVRDYLVKSDYVHDGNVACVDGITRRVQFDVSVQEPFPEDTSVTVTAPELPDVPETAGIGEIIKALDPASTGSHLVRLLKADVAPAEERYVLGIVLEPEVVDSQNEVYNAEEIRKSAHTFLTKYRHVGLQHTVVLNGMAEVVESFLAPTDMTIGEQMVKAGTWLMGIHVIEDTLWEACKDGTLTGLSVGGLAVRNPVPVSTKA